MIMIEGYPFDISTVDNKYPEDTIERELLNKMYLSIEQYKYNSLNTLMFELDLRKEIVSAAKELDASDLSFADFEQSRCNYKYWNRTDNGGFRLKEGVKPSDAINDIITNGDKYATECATAMMIVYYKALLNVFGEDSFNKTFYEIYLMDWDVKEPLLKEVAIPKNAPDVLLGDRQYFSNPDVDPMFPEWQGENVIALPGSMYYGHGIGITTSDRIIHALNSKRKEDATQSAYLTNSVGRPNFEKLADAYYNYTTQTTTLVWKAFPASIFRI